MKVGELIDILSSFSKEQEVTITDGYKPSFYKLDDAIFSNFEEDDGSISVDIGIGGCEQTGLE